MALQIANPTVVMKIERLAKRTGLTKTAAVERAVDAMLAGDPESRTADVWERFDLVLAQIDRLPDTSNFIDPLTWDEDGLPV